MTEENGTPGEKNPVESESLIKKQEIHKTFERIYEKNEWGSSGPGSNPFINLGYRSFLETFLQINNVRDVTDVGCGDWQYSRFINLDRIKYRGYDVVANLVDTNTKKYGRENIEFRLMPEDEARLPGGDLLIMKDVLQHLPDAMIHKYHKEVFPKFRWVLVTNSWKKLNTPQNVESHLGGFRCLDVAAPPYRFKGAYVFECWAEWERIRTFLICN